MMKHIKRIEFDVFNECYNIGKKIYYNKIKDNTNNALYYVRLDIKVSWMKHMLITKVIDNHKFMKS